MMRSLNGSALVVAVATATASHLGAQQRPDTVELNPVVVTATRITPAQTPTSASATVLRGDELRRKGIVTVAEALRDVPAALPVASGSPGSVTSLFLRGGESDFVKVLIDGVPANEPGGRFDFATLTTDNIDRIEVVRGPASVLYGSDAVSGVVQIFTRDGRGAVTVDGGVRAGTAATREGDLSVAGGSRSMGYTVAAAHRETDGFLPFNNDHTSRVGSGSLRLGGGGRGDLRLRARIVDAEYHFPTDGGGALVDSNQFTTERSAAISADAGVHVNGRVELRALLAASEIARSAIDRPDNAGDTLGFYASESRSRQRRHAIESRANVRLPAGVIVAGLAGEWANERTRSQSSSDLGPFSDAFDDRRWNRSVFVHGMTTGSLPLSLTAGARIDHNERFGTFPTYRMGVATRARGGVRARAAFGTAFKEPTFYEQNASGFVTGNRNLDPERSRSAEVGVDYESKDGELSLSATSFWQRFSDLVQYAPTTASGDPDYFNLAAASARGIEVSARVRPHPVVRINGSYAFLRTKVLDPGGDDGAGATFVAGEPLIRRPAHSGALSVGVVTARASADAVIRYTGKRDDRDFSTYPATPVKLGGHAVVALSVEAPVFGAAGRPAVVLTSRIENALDRRYQEIANFAAPRRTVLFGARIGVGR